MLEIHYNCEEDSLASRLDWMNQNCAAFSGQIWGESQRFCLGKNISPAAHMFTFPHQNALAACEFLLQNGAQVNQADSNGRGPLHHATILGHTG